jgi:hypothetical protein
MRLFQNPVAAEVTRLKLQAFQGIWSLLTGLRQDYDPAGVGG